MKKTAKRSHLSILAASLLTLAMFLSLSWLVRAQNQNALVIEITAKKCEYSISPVHVKIGTKVQLKITATDHDDDFKIAAVPDGSVLNGTGGLIFTSAQDC